MSGLWGAQPGIDILPTGPLLVGFSGGIDSVALLTALHTAGRPVAAAHVHHGIRGADADADLQFCREFCRDRSLPFFSIKLDVPARARAARENIEAAARAARLEFFSALCAAYKFVGVALAHHADDQAETIFMRLLRGAGWRGLCGMAARTTVPVTIPPLETIETLSSIPPAQKPPAFHSGTVYQLPLFRPFLTVTRAEIAAYVRACHLPWREDQSNCDPAFTRNWLRQRFFPALSQVYPDYRERLLRFAAAARRHTAPPPAASREWGGIFVPWTAVAKDSFPCSPAAAAGTVSPLAALASALEQFLPRFRRDNFTAVNALIQGKLRTVNLPGDYILRRENDGCFAIFRNFVPNETPQTFTALPFVYETADYRLTAEAVTLPGKIPDCSLRTVEYLNPDILSWPLTVRLPHIGEKFAPFGKGAPARQKITAVLNASAYPLRIRALLPVLADAAGILWITPLRLARRAALTPTNGVPIRAVRVEFTFKNQPK